MSGHSKGVKKGKFCALRKKKCDHNAYQENCTPAPTGWSTFSFLQGKKRIKPKVFEAHHLLCIACVTEFIGKDERIYSIVKQTDWCINSTTNMFAMPIWGHTIKWYCDVETSGLKLNERIKSNLEAPPFVNVPQHDYDHNSENGYTSEVDEKMIKLAQQIQKKAKQDHEAAVELLQTQLNNLSNKFRTKLQSRGSSRCGGTHKAWEKGKKEPDSDWYLPFSMADDGNVNPRSFPTSDFNGTVAEKIQSLVQAFQNA